MVAAGQTILLSGSGTTLGFLGAAGSGGQHGQGTVYYTDGSTASFQLSLASYLGPPGPGDEPVAILRYVNGGPAGPAYVYYAGVPIAPAKTVQAVTLPKDDAAPLKGMHIFAVAIGPLQFPE